MFFSINEQGASTLNLLITNYVSVSVAVARNERHYELRIIVNFDYLFVKSCGSVSCLAVEPWELS